MTIIVLELDLRLTNNMNTLPYNRTKNKNKYNQRKYSFFVFLFVYHDDGLSQTVVHGDGAEHPYFVAMRNEFLNKMREDHAIAGMSDNDVQKVLNACLVACDFRIEDTGTGIMHRPAAAEATTATAPPPPLSGG